VKGKNEYDNMLKRVFLGTADVLAQVLGGQDKPKGKGKGKPKKERKTKLHFVDQRNQGVVSTNTDDMTAEMRKQLKLTVDQHVVCVTLENRVLMFARPRI
jgi:hypothetical protein